MAVDFAVLPLWVSWAEHRHFESVQPVHVLFALVVVSSCSKVKRVNFDSLNRRVLLNEFHKLLLLHPEYVHCRYLRWRAEKSVILYGAWETYKLVVWCLLAAVYKPAVLYFADAIPEWHFKAWVRAYSVQALVVFHLAVKVQWASWCSQREVYAGELMFFVLVPNHAAQLLA